MTFKQLGKSSQSDSRYKVPIHQRDFSWTLEEVMQLWDDITDSIIEDRPEYFLGTVVVQESREEKTRVIIDGQQRLATLTMLLSGIRTVYNENDDERADEVYNDYLGMRDRRTRVTDPRLSLNEVNEPVFQRLVVENSSDDEMKVTINDKNTTPSNVLLARAALYIRDVIRQRSKNSKKIRRFPPRAGRIHS